MSLRDDEFTEEEAAEKLKELGFDVIAVTDLEITGYSIEQFDNGHWAVMEVHRNKNDGHISRMNLSGWLDGRWEAYGWLGAYMGDHEWEGK